MAKTVTSSWNQDRVELAYFEQLRKDSAILPTIRAVLDREYAANSLPACGSTHLQLCRVQVLLVLEVESGQWCMSLLEEGEKIAAAIMNT